MHFVQKLTVIALFSIGLFLSSIFGGINTIQAEPRESTTVIVFLRNGCTHCEDEEKYLDALTNRRGDVRVTKYRLDNPEERKLWESFTEKNGISKVTPITIIGGYYIVGYDSDETTGVEIEKLIDTAKNSGAETSLEGDIVPAAARQNATCSEDGSVPCEADNSYVVTVPFIGTLDTSRYSLIVLSAVLGFFDGFNPCAMWVLVMFITMLAQIGDRKKMLLFVGVFVLAEAIMYSLILTVWYKTWDFVQLDAIVTPVVGILAVGGGIFFLREWRKKELECKVTNLSQRKKIIEKINYLAASKFSLVTLLGILGIAFSVNIIEFACSIGIPQSFTKILEINELPFLSSLFYISVYILFYMVDDFIVFGIALYSFDKLHLTTKYSRLSNLVGGIVMILLGLLLMFKPSILLF